MTVIDSSASTAPDGAEAAGDATGDRSDDKAGSLLPVIRVIPKSAYENPTWKGLAFFARDLVFYGLVLWALTSTDNPLLLIPLWIVSALVVSGLFIIGHDAAHEALFKSRRLNSDRRPRGHAAVVARVRGLGARPQPGAPRPHRPRGHGLRLAPRHPRAVRGDERSQAAAPPHRVVAGTAPASTTCARSGSTR